MDAEPRLTFRVDGVRFAVPAARVRAVARVPRLTRVPHAPPGLIGLGNVRGAVVPVLSFARLIDRPPGEEMRILLVDADEPVGIAVDRVEGLARDDDDAQVVAIEALIAATFAPATRRRAGGGAAVAAPQASTRDETVPLLVFGVADQAFALPASAVEAVLRLPAEITPFPGADPVVVGSVAVRGTLLPLLSLATLLALPAGAAATHPRVVVVRIGAHRVGLVVDGVRGISRVAESGIDPVPAVFRRGGGEARIQAICRLDGGRRLVSVLAVEHLLSETLTARLLQAEEEMPVAANAVEAHTEPFLRFRIGDGAFGLPIAAVDAVVAVPETLARLPNAPVFVLGAMPLRGAVLPVVDQVRRFDGAAAHGRKRRVVVVRVDDRQVGFAVDAVSEVARVPVSALGRPPGLSGDGGRVFDRVASLDGERIVLIVSPRDLLDRTERDMLAAFTTKAAATHP